MMLRVVLLALLLLTAGCDRDLPTSPNGRPCPGLPFGGSASVSGQVTYDGAPLPAAEVRIGEVTSVTGADGRFLMSAMTGTQDLVVGPPENGEMRGTVLVLSRSNEIRIVTARTSPDGAASGRTLDGCTGRPIPGVILELGSYARTVSDESGFFVFPKLCCSTLPKLVATKAGYETAYRDGLGRFYGEAKYFDIVMVPSAGD